jgi:hypothetical protein
MTGATQSMVDFCNKLSYEELSPAVIDRVKYLALDFLGVAIGGPLTESGKAVRNFAGGTDTDKDGKVIDTIKEPKTRHSRRRIAFSPSLGLVLRQHRAAQERQRALLGEPLTDEDFAFAHPDGTPLDPSTVSHTFNKIIRRVGLPHIRLHDLRHTHATLLLQAGVHPKVVQERLGHSSIRVTLDTYSHVIGGLQEAAAQRFDDLLTATSAENVAKMSPNSTEDAGKYPI